MIVGLVEFNNYVLDPFFTVLQPTQAPKNYDNTYLILYLPPAHRRFHLATLLLDCNET